MLRHVTVPLLTEYFENTVFRHLKGVFDFAGDYLTDTLQMRVVSLLFFLFALTLLLALVVVMAVKSFLHFIRRETADLAVVDPSERQKTEEADKRAALALENELERELEKSRQLLAENLRVRKSEEEERRLQEDQKRTAERTITVESEPVFKVPQAFEFRPVLAKGKDHGAGHGFRFDRENGFAFVPTEQPSASDGAVNRLENMSGLIMNMLGRKIETGKIVQVIKNKTGVRSTEEDVIQTVDAVRRFVFLCSSGIFFDLQNRDVLPTEREALEALDHNDPTVCLQLLQALMNQNVEKTKEIIGPSKKSAAFSKIADYTCLFGHLAALYDTQTAQEAYETAIEFVNDHVEAWNRVGDMYKRQQESSVGVSNRFGKSRSSKGQAQNCQRESLFGSIFRGKRRNDDGRKTLCGSGGLL
jgi:hypothetical protein